MNVINSLIMTNSDNFPEILSEYSKDFRRIYLSGIYGHITSSGVESIVYSEEILLDEALKSPKIDRGHVKIKRTVECMLIIDPTQMVALHNWLDTKIKEYEHVFGKILTPDEIKEKIMSLKQESSEQ